MYKTERAQELITRFVSGYIVKNLGANPLITITETRLSKDNHNAKIFYLVYPDNDSAKKEARKKLTNFRGMIKSALISGADLNFISQIDFVFDEGALSAQRVEEL